MARPLLFNSIKRAKFDALEEPNKDYIIKEEDGSTSKYIHKLENSGAVVAKAVLKVLNLF